MDIFEVECNMLRNLVVNLHKDTPSTASNNRATDNSVHTGLKEDEIVHQVKDPMEIETQNSPHTDEGQDEVDILHVYL